MKWIVVETSIERTVSDFGPFDTMVDATEFVHKHQMPWSSDFLNTITINKVNDNHEINQDI